MEAHSGLGARRRRRESSHHVYGPPSSLSRKCLSRRSKVERCVSPTLLAVFIVLTDCVNSWTTNVRILFDQFALEENKKLDPPSYSEYAPGKQELASESKLASDLGKVSLANAPVTIS